MLVFYKDEICLMQMVGSYEEVEILEEIHQRKLDLEGEDKNWFVYKIAICIMPDIILYVKPELLYKIPHKDITLEWEKCIWKPNTKVENKQ